MFGQNKQDDEAEGQTVPVSVNNTSEHTESAPAVTHDELNLPVPDVDESTVSEDTSAPDYIETPAVEPPVNAFKEPTPDVELSSPPVTLSTSGSKMDLSALKLEALHELSPLIGQLDLSPEEKYATAKMVYEETNDQALLSSVYEAAKDLPDDKTKAEAIYDVIKKINEFSA